MKINGFLRPSAFILVICALLALSCRKSTATPHISKNIVLPAGAAPIIQASNQFAFDYLHADLLLDNASGNRLISPLSIYVAFSMVCNGAANDTRDSIEIALRLENIDLADLNSTCQSLLQQLPGEDNEVSLSMADAVWYQPSIQPQPAFIKTINTSYQATAQALNFNDPGSVNTINTWVADHTQQKIPKLIDQLPANELMFLANAIYFKGAWKSAFNKNYTNPTTFYRPDNTSISAPFMTSNTTTFPFFHNDSLQIAQLPYGGGNFNMYIIEPTGNLSVAAFLPALDAGYFQFLQSQLSPLQMILTMPKFSYSYSIENMQPTLGSMGMDLAFERNADFSLMYNVPAYLSTAVHKTFIEVDEEGTVAAAATGVGVVTATVPAIPFIRFDHPFVYIIQEKTSGVILFTGVVNDPTLP